MRVQVRQPTHFIGVYNGNNTTQVEGALGKQGEGAGSSGRSMRNAFLNKLGVVGHTSQENTLPHEIHGSQLYLSFFEETFTGNWHA